ncbi:hypothetical protein HPB49_019220 [Dermacentor silvarum]|uniref:Uncharacterized protein n=1 Tax=Dermacentor silvarum TaxID=543639 RepID=A0ACB8E2G3_DERSI|nr:hypothetical protein HPB49_019220 [Dermacentor silvarum]
MRLQGWNDVSYHGCPQIRTPNIDALAWNGIRLRRYYTQPLCTPSRAALLTGRYPLNIGFQHSIIYNEEPRGLPLWASLLPQWLADLGYVTHHLGKRKVNDEDDVSSRGRQRRRMPRNTKKKKNPTKALPGFSTHPHLQYHHYHCRVPFFSARDITRRLSPLEITMATCVLGLDGSVTKSKDTTRAVFDSTVAAGAPATASTRSSFLPLSATPSCRASSVALMQTPSLPSLKPSSFQPECAAWLALLLPEFVGATSEQQPLTQPKSSVRVGLELSPPSLERGAPGRPELGGCRHRHLCTTATIQPEVGGRDSCHHISHQASAGV